MSTQADRDTAGPAAGTENSARLRRWAARRARQLSRVAVVLAFVLACGVVGVLIWRSASLLGLPDVGDPFDGAAVDGVAVPADRDAFVFFRRARARLRPMPAMPRSVMIAGPVGGWSKADPELRRWVESNREAMEAFRQGAAQPDGIAHAAEATAFSSDRVILHPFAWLALLEGSRLEERGEMAEAWAWYRALLEMRAHIMRRGTVFERYFAEHDTGWLLQRVAAWANDPRTEVPLLRLALDDAMKYHPRPEWDASSLKVDYRLMMRELDRPDGPLAGGYDDDLEYRIAGEMLPPNLAQSVYAARRFLLNEPERSRRVLRLIFANWLARVEAPEEGRRKPAVRAIYRGGSTTSVPLYAPGPDAPTGASPLAPRDLIPWLFKAHDAKRLLFQWPWPSISLRERQRHRALVVILAEALYRRERGGPPPSEDALVGPYLEGLPDDGMAELDDGTTPIVEEAPAPIRE
jgi:hypothetical protein